MLDCLTEAKLALRDWSKTKECRQEAVIMKADACMFYENIIYLAPEYNQSIKVHVSIHDCYCIVTFMS